MTAIPKPRLLASAAADVKSLNFFPNVKVASLRKNQVSHHQLIRKKSEKRPRRLIRISTSDGKWHGKWNHDYKFSLHDLHLQDLDHHLNNNHNEVSINLCIQKHAGFGLSVDGKIITSLTRKCTNCSSPYCREIDTNFNVWVLPSSRSQKKSEHHHHLPEIGGDDPSVIYVKPGDEINLDSLIQDTIRLATAVKETCSESCEKSEPVLQHVGAKYAASIDKRWSTLLQLTNPPQS